MELLVIRHGIAEDLPEGEEPPPPDFERRLTVRGHTRTVRAVKGLRRIYPDLDIVAASPLIRAAETAAIVAKQYDCQVVTELPALAPQAPWEALLGWLKGQPSEARVALIGHEPHLGRWCSWVLSGMQRPLFHFKKSGACLLSMEDPLTPGEGELSWLLTARQLRALGGGS